MTEAEFKEVNIAKSYDCHPDVLNYKEYSFWQNRVGVKTTSRFICEICDETFKGTFASSVLKDVFCPNCEEFSCVFYETLKIDSRYDFKEADDYT